MAEPIGEENQERQQRRRVKKGDLLKWGKNLFKIIRKIPLPITITVVAVIIIILLVIGVLGFFLTMPGMVQDKLVELSSKFWNPIQQIFIGNWANINEEDEIKLAEYLENMGYDLYGYGFGKVKRDENTNEITEVESKYLLGYLMGDYTTYAEYKTSNNTALQKFVQYIKKGDQAPNGMIRFIDGKFDWFAVGYDSKGIFGILSPQNVLINTISEWINKAIGDQVTVDRAAKKMIFSIKHPELSLKNGIQIKDTTYQFNMDGWTGRYGKPLEFLLALHLATMAPDLPYQIVVDKDIETEIQIKLQEYENSRIEMKYRLTSPLEDGWQNKLKVDGWTGEDKLDELKDLAGKNELEQTELEKIRDVLRKYAEENKGDTSGVQDTDAYKYGDPSTRADVVKQAETQKTNEALSVVGENLKKVIGLDVSDVNNLIDDNSGKFTYKQPYISQVIKTWFKPIFFEGGSTEAKEAGIPDDFNAYEFSTEETKTEMPYSGGIKNDLGETVAVRITKGSMSQKAQPMKGEINPKTKELFVGAGNEDINGTEEKPLYYIYDGSKETADEIDRLQEIEATLDGMTFQEKMKYLNQNEDKQDVIREISMTKNSLAAFTILENMKTADADMVLRDLKELMIELKYYTRKDFNILETLVLDWIVPEYRSGNWPVRKTDKQDYEYGTKISFKKELPEEELTAEQRREYEGFEEGMKVITPGVGNITGSGKDEKTGKDYIEIEFTQPELVAGMTMRISGFNLDLSKAEYNDDGTLKKETEIGTTANCDMNVILRDSKKAVIEDVENYMMPKAQTSALFEEVSEEFMYWQANQCEGFPCSWLSDPGNQYRRRSQLGDTEYGWDFGICDGGANDPTLCPGIFLGRRADSSDSYIGPILRKMGYTNLKVGGWVKATDMVDVYYQEMKYNIEFIKKNLNKEVSQNEMEALLDVCYAGPGHMKPLLEDINNGNVTQESFYKTIRGNGVGKYSFAWKRRVADYKLYTEGKYYGTHESNKYYEFTSETPFQDMINDVNSGNLVQ